MVATLAFRQWPQWRLRAGAAAAGPQGTCRVPSNPVGFDRRTGAPFGVLSHRHTPPALFGLRGMNWGSGSSMFLLAGIAGIWLRGVCALSRDLTRDFTL